MEARQLPVLCSMIRSLSSVSLGLLLASAAMADDFYRLDTALPANVDIRTNYPVFDFDSDGCLHSAGISRLGQRNGGLNPSGSITGGCRPSSFLDTSNTLHRHACILNGGDVYGGHFYALYFLKDQGSALGWGHRHDWEHALRDDNFLSNLNTYKPSSYPTFTTPSHAVAFPPGGGEWRSFGLLMAKWSCL